MNDDQFIKFQEAAQIVCELCIKRESSACNDCPVTGTLGMHDAAVRMQKFIEEIENK